MTGIHRSDRGDLARNANAYLDFIKWVCVITSVYALRNFSKIVKPPYYEELWSKVCELGDDGLKEIAFENYVHTLARDGTNIKLRVREYDRKKEKKDHSYTKLDFEPKQCRSDGKDAAECDAIMEQFASSSDDYWYPSCRSLETIDCVAKLKMNGLSEVVGLIQITKSDKHTIAPTAINKYADFFPSDCCYIALVPDKTTCDAFRLAPADPDTKVPLKVAYLENSPQ